MANSPTIVAASLDSKALEESINKLVQTINAKTTEMAKSFTDKVGQMEQAVKNLGNIKFDTNASSGGGAKKISEGQKELETQTKRTTQAAKEQQMTFDQLVQGLKQAMGVVSNFNTLRQHIDPSKQDYAEYERALARIVEYHGRLKNSALALAEANEKAFTFDARRSVDGLFVKDERLKQLNRYYAEEEKSAQRRQEQINKEVELYNEAIRKKGDAAQKQIEKEQQARDKMAESVRRAEEKYQDAVLNKAWRDARRMPVTNEDQAIAKIERIKSLVESLHPIGIISKADVDAANALVSKLEKQYNLQKNIGQQGSWTNIGKVNVNQTKESLNEINAAVEKNRKIAINAELEKRLQIIQTGTEAVYTAKKIAEAMNEKIVKGEQITELKELENAWRQMRQALSNSLSPENKEFFAEMLAKTELAIAAVKRYNEEVQKTATQQQPKNIGSSYIELSETLKSLTATYHTYNSEQRNSAALGVATADRIHRVNQEIRDIQRQMNRPTSLAKAIGMDESTLDHIADKIQALRAYKSGIKLTDAKSLDEMNQVDAHINRLTKDMDKYMGKGQQVVKTNTALGRSWNYMKNRLAFYFTVGASTAFVKNLIEIRSQYEMNERALGILINSAERGTQIFKELSDMALVSPYTLIELSSAAKQLTAYDIAAKDVVDTTRRLADMASAVGVPMERLTYALGQIKAYGYLNSRDARMFANAGIPLVKQLADYYTQLEGKIVSVGDVYDRMKKKAIDYNSVMAVVTKMTDEGGKFFDFQAKMADTLKVRLANLTLAWNNMLNEIGDSTQGVLATGISALRDLFLHWKDIDGMIQKILWALGLWKGAQMIALAFTGELTTAMGMQVLVGKRLQETLASTAAATKAFSASTLAIGAGFWLALADIIVTWRRNTEEIERLNKTIEDGAKEASEALDKMLHSSEMVSARISAATNKLSASDATKTWDVLREQIELSADSSQLLITQLLLEEDLNKRVTDAFNLAERIQQATSKLSDLNDALEVSQDSILGGALWEGLAEDIDDYNARLKYEAELAEWTAKENGDFWENAVMGLKGLFHEVKESLGSSSDEAQAEILKFSRNAAQVIKDELGEEGLKDKVQINEAVARVIKGIEQMFPQIRGKGKVLFETLFYDVMSNEFKGAVDSQAYYYEKFLSQLKKDHGSAFGDITDDILKDTHKWSSAQLDAIQKTADKVRKDLPAASQGAIDEILSQLNNTEFKVRIVAQMATTSLDDVQKQFRQKFIETPWIADVDARQKAETENQQKYGTLMRKNTESNAEYEERISKERQKQLDLQKKNADIIESNKNKQDAYSKAVTKDAEKAKDVADAWLKAADEVEKAGGYDFSTKKERSAASKAQKAAETELQKALKDEIQLIEQVRSQYKKLTDAGVKHGTALTMVTTQFGASIEHINDVLQKNGMPKFDVKAFAGTDDPHAILAMLRAQIDRAKASSSIKPEEIKALEVEYGKVVVDAQVYDTTKITKGLNNELDKLKEEYELAVELDANPELGGMFAEMFDIDLETLPKTAEEYADQYTKFLNKYLKEKGSDLSLPNLLNLTSWDMNAFREQMEKGDMNKEWYDVILKGYLATREARKKETSETIKDYEKLLEKYAEYETKVNKIQNDAVKERVTFAQQFGSEDDKNMALNLQTQILAATDPQEKQKLIQQLQELVKSIAGDDKAKLNIVTSIGNSETKGLAKASFEEFQKSPEWITATGELSGMTNKAINGLIASLEKYKKSAKNLDPKQIKNINNALKNLYKEQRKNNPFGAIANMIDKAKERMADVEPEMESIMSDIIALEKEIGDGEATEEQIKTLDDLKERWQTLSKIGEISAGEWVDSLMSVYGAIKGAIGLFDDLAKAIGGTSASDIEKIFGVLDKAGQGAQIGAAFGGYGAVIGAVVGAATGIIETFADQWSGNAAITEEVEESVRAVKHLEFAYLDLQQAVDKAYGTAVIGAKQATLANKELQLAELQRQIQLEKSRKSKNRDEDKILDLQKQYKELFYEIQNGYTELVDDLMGTDVAGFAENLVSSMIDAFKQGEDYMDVFNKKFDEMIDNMIMKSIVSRVVSQYLNQIWDSIDQRINDRSQEERNEYAKAQSKAEKVREMSDGELAMEIAKQRLNDGVDMLQTLTTLTDKDIEEYRKAVAAEEIAAKKRLDAATEFTDSDIDYVLSQITGVMPELGERLKAILGKYYKFGEASDKNLSALQQGIQGITEDTAGALEGYMNGVSQQVYLQSTLLTQIRDAVVGLTTDAGLGVQTQMLFQLQQSYLVQQSIEGMMRNVLSPSERAFQVELIS